MQHPVEEIGLHRTTDALFLKRGAGENVGGIVGLQFEDPGGDRLGDDGQVGVLEKQPVGADLLAIDLAQQVVPQVALELCLGIAGQAGPEVFKSPQGAPEGQAVASQFGGDG